MEYMLFSQSKKKKMLKMMIFFFFLNDWLKNDVYIYIINFKLNKYNDKLYNET